MIEHLGKPTASKGAPISQKNHGFNLNRTFLIMG